MALDLDPNHVFRDFVTPGIPSSGNWNPRKPEIRQLLTEWWQTLIALVADAGGLELPNLLIRYEVTGGDENNIIAEANLPVPSGPGVAVFSIVIEEANTGPVTINGKPLLSNTGNPLAAGALAADGIYLFLDNGDSYRLLSDYVSSSIVAAAEAAAVIASGAAGQAVDAAERAESAAAEVEYPVSYAPQTLTPEQQEQARENIGLYRVSDISSIKALDPNQVKSVYLDSGGRSGEFVWTPGDHSAVVAADTLNGLYIAPDSDPSGASGAWVRKFDGDEALVDWWGAVGNKTMDCSAAFQAAVDTLSARIVGGSFGGTLVLGVGDYRLGTKVDWKPRVSMRGSGRNSTYIRSLGGSITNMINVENISTGGISFKSFTIVGEALQTYAFAVGSVLEETSGLVFEDIRFIQHITSVRPLHTYAMFDGTFKDCRFDQCDRGLVVAGSQINIENCSFSQNNYGVVIRKHAAPSIGGGKFFGGVFAGNTFDVVLDGDVIRPTAFYGTWFEGTGTSVIAQINAPSVLLLLGLVFKDCLFQPSAGASGAGFALMGNWAGRMAIENCTIYQTPLAGADVPGSGWSAPQTGRARYTVYGTILTNGTEAGTIKRADVDIG